MTVRPAAKNVSGKDLSLSSGGPLPKKKLACTTSRDAIACRKISADGLENEATQDGEKTTSACRPGERHASAPKAQEIWKKAGTTGIISTTSGWNLAAPEFRPASSSGHQTFSAAGAADDVVGGAGSSASKIVASYSTEQDHDQRADQQQSPDYSTRSSCINAAGSSPVITTRSNETSPTGETAPSVLPNGALCIPAGNMFLGWTIVQMPVFVMNSPVGAAAGGGAPAASGIINLNPAPGGAATGGPCAIGGGCAVSSSSCSSPPDERRPAAPHRTEVLQPSNFCITTTDTVRGISAAAP